MEEQNVTETDYVCDICGFSFKKHELIKHKGMKVCKYDLDYDS